MKKRAAALAIAVIACAILAAGPLAAAGQAARPAGAEDIKAAVSSIVGRFPAETAAAQATPSAPRSSGSGPAAIAETCARVLPPGAGDDSEGPVRRERPGRLCHPGRARRPSACSSSGACSTPSPRVRTRQVAAFFITQVQLAGKAEAVKPLARYLVGRGRWPDRPRPPSRRSAAPRPPGRSSKALDAAPPPARLSIVDALGALRSREAVKKLLVLAESADEGLRRAARFALANIGDPAAGAVLSKVRVTLVPAERAEAPALYLLYARRLAESGKTAEGLAAARSILASHGGPEESQVASEALALIVSILKDKAVPDLLARRRQPGPRGPRARPWSLARDARGERGDRPLDREGRGFGARTSGPRSSRCSAGAATQTALPFVRESLREPRRGRPPGRHPRRGPPRRRGRRCPTSSGSSAPPAKTRPQALKTALLGFDGRQVVPEAVRLLDSTPHPGKAVLIDILGEKGARGEIERVFALAADADPATRAAALGALAKIGRRRRPPPPRRPAREGHRRATTSSGCRRP